MRSTRYMSLAVTSNEIKPGLLLVLVQGLSDARRNVDGPLGNLDRDKANFAVELERRDVLIGYGEASVVTLSLIHI